MRRRMFMGATTSVYLYNQGDECTDITGGWELQGRNVNAPNVAKPVFSKEADHLLLDEMNARGTRSVTTANKIDLSGYRKIVIDCTAESLTENGEIIILIAPKVINNTGALDMNATFGDYREIASFTNTTFSGRLECDISDLTEGYPVFYISNSKNNAPQQLRVYSAKLVR